jgi:hypothetical protein
VVWKGVPDLLSRPCRGRMVSHIHMDDAAAVVGQDDQDEQHAEGRGCDGEKPVRHTATGECAGTCARSATATMVAGPGAWRPWVRRSRCSTSDVRRKDAERPTGDLRGAFCGSARGRRRRGAGDRAVFGSNASASARRRGGDATRRRWRVARCARRLASRATLVRAAPTGVDQLV